MVGPRPYPRATGLDGDLAVQSCCVEHAATIDDVPVLLHNDVLVEMRDGLIGGAKPLSEVPRTLSRLPAASVAIDRVAFSICLLPDEYAQQHQMIASMTGGAAS